jgi:FtsP/CotA-like multicopper oxidase with cupredoxin domain
VTAKAVALFIFGLGLSPAVFAQSLAPASWDAGVPLAAVTDRNPDPHIVEIDLDARTADVDIAGKPVHVWTYNGSLPGPLIRASVGDRLIVHFTNRLPSPTTVHWHGIRVPIEMDGVPGISQEEVKTGESFTYDFVLRDAGLYWYHPHVMSAAQVGAGLYGALLVEDPNDGVGVPDQVTLVLSDLGFDKNGDPDPADTGGSAGMVFGREGEFLLVNGKNHPVLTARAGASQRWRIVNTAKSRFFLLNLEGQNFHVIGSDGGLLERPTDTDELLITPGERVDVIVQPTGKPGGSIMLRAMLYNRGYGSVEYRTIEDLMTVQFSKDAAVKRAPLPATTRAITAATAAGATTVNFSLTLPKIENRKPEFRVNDKPFWQAEPYHAKIGESQVWVVKNDTDWDHPFHLHGFFFQVLDDRNEPVRPLALKDTVNVPMKTTVRLLVTFDERPGEWMFHCHILDHADGGLMGTVMVGDPTGTKHVHTADPRKP